MVNKMKKIKRKKISIKKILFLIIPLIIIIIIFINRHYLITLYQSKTTGYEYNSIEAFHEYNIYPTIKEHEYSHTLDKIITTEYYNPKYLNSYFDIEYKEKENYYEEINSLLGLGYNAKEINDIYKSLSTDSINLLINNNYLKDISLIMNLNYFHEDYLERYLKYNKDNLSYEDIITYVNIGLDKEYYTGVINIEDPTDISVIVNKYHKLSSDYVPSDLETIANKYNRGYNNKLRKVAKEAFEEMCEGALKDDITIYSGSAYRSYSYQKNLYDRYVNTNGFKEAETFSARAGYSEHQTGLATDILNKRQDYISANDKEYEWLVNNSYKYGFILRYPKGKDNITGYMYEEWHFRYVGKDLAKKIIDSQLTYDEYVARNS